MYGCSIVLTHRLKPYQAAIAKKDYGTVVKPYVKAVHEKLVAEGKPERAAIFKAGIPGVIKKFKAIWDDLIPYRGESENENGMLCFLNYRKSGDPYMIFFKDGLEEEKVVSIKEALPNMQHCSLKCLSHVRGFYIFVIFGYS